jgi:pyrroline-5-carboxylate reductase
MLTESIGLIGAGQMATALGQGFVRAGLVPGHTLLAADPLPEARERFTATTGGRATADNAEAAGRSDVVILAVKPQHIARAMADLRGAISPRQLVISIAAGIRLATLAEGLGPRTRLIRAMPNTPCLVGTGASAYCLGPHATAADGQLAERLLRAVGIAFPVEEKLLDAVTGLSGCGPAFVYVVVEALGDGGVRMGLPPNIAAALAAQTVLGAGQMLVSSGEQPSVLKDRVASSGGATVAGLQALEEGGLRGALVAAVGAATRRAMELGAS